MSIPATQIVTVTPSVLSAGGRALQLNAVFMTTSTRVPVNTVAPFPDADSVGAYFGLDSTEYAAAAQYFLGFRKSNRKPGMVFFFSYLTAPASAYLRGGSLASLTLSALKAMAGTISVMVDGTVKTSSAISLAAATSFSNAATIIQTAFSGAGVNVTFDPLSSSFVFTSATTGVNSSVAFATGALANSLNLASGLGGVLSIGSAAMTPASAMNAVKSKTTNWATFTTVFEPTPADSIAFAVWNAAQNQRFFYAMWGSDPAPTVFGDTTSIGYQAETAELDGASPIYANAPDVAAFLLGSIASLDFGQKNGRATMAFRNVDGLAPDVTDGTVSQNLKLNGYNFYGTYATANDEFTFFHPGTVIGQYDWIDSYICQIWLTNQLQLAMMTLLTEVYSIPYNEEGRTLIHAAALDPILAALNFGAIRTGVTLSELQKAELNEAAGVKIDDVVSQVGWYFQVLDTAAQDRKARTSPPINLFYADGQSVQQINVGSVAVQ